MILINVKQEKLNKGLCVGQALEYTIHEASVAKILQSCATLICCLSNSLIDVFFQWHLHKLLFNTANLIELTLVEFYPCLLKYLLGLLLSLFLNLLTRKKCEITIIL